MPTSSLSLERVKLLSRDLSSILDKVWFFRRQVEKILRGLQFASLVDLVGKALLRDLNGYLGGWAKKALKSRDVSLSDFMQKILMLYLRPVIL